MANSIFKKIFWAISLSFACLQAADNSAFNAGGEWGWGGTTDSDASEKKPIEIPYFDQDIGEHLLKKDFRYIADADNVRESFMRSINVYNRPFGRLAYFGYSNEKFYKDVYAYLASSDWEKDLKKLSPSDAAFVRTVVYFCFIGIEEPRYIQIQLDKIENSDQLKFLREFFRVKRQKEALRSGYWHMFIGLGANFFSHGANDKLAPGPAFDLGFGYCIVGMFCTDFRIGSMFAVTPYKEDIVQSNVTYPKEEITYTAVEALLRAKLIYTYDYEFSVFGGLRLHAIEFDTEEGKLYKERGSKDMSDGYSYSYTMGFEGAKYFGGNGAMPKLFGVGARVGVANFGDNILDVGGYNWYGGIDLIVRLTKP